MKQTAVYGVDREFCEKLIALSNHSTNPMMDIFSTDKAKKMRIVIDYDPQAEKVEFTYFVEE